MLCLGRLLQHLQGGCWKSIQICLQSIKRAVQDNLDQGDTIASAMKVIEMSVFVLLRSWQKDMEKTLMWEHGKPIMNIPVMIQRILIVTQLDQHLKIGLEPSIQETGMMAIYRLSMKPGEMCSGQWSMRTLIKLNCQILR